MLLTCEMHTAFQTDVGQDFRNLGVYLDALEDDGRYPLLVHIGRMGIEPTYSRHKLPGRSRPLFWGRYLRQMFLSGSTGAPMPIIEVLRWRGENRRWLVGISFTHSSIAQRAVRYESNRDLVQALRDGVLCHKDRLVIVQNYGLLLNSFGSILCDDGREKLMNCIASFVRKDAAREEFIQFLAREMINPFASITSWECALKVERFLRVKLGLKISEGEQP